MQTSNTAKHRSSDESHTDAEIRRLQRLLAAKEQELQALRGELDHYFQAISHELRGPLVALEGFTSLLIERIHPLLDAESRGYLDRIRANIGHLETLLSNITQMARAEAHGSEMAWFPARYALEEALASLQEEVQGSEADVRTVSELPVCYGYSSAIMQVFRNLIANAIKYAKAEQKPVVRIGYEGHEIFHKFYVKDHGIGLHRKDREKAFQLFTRLGNKPGERGSGLGLAFVKRIVQAHGGEVWVRSSPGRGATFFFTLPRFASGDPAADGQLDQTSFESSSREARK